MSSSKSKASIASKNEKEDDQISDKKIYFGLCFFASACFSFGNFIVGELANGVGPFAILYYASGSLFASIAFYVV